MHNMEPTNRSSTEDETEKQPESPALQIQPEINVKAKGLRHGKFEGNGAAGPGRKSKACK